ncbi:MAG TPA: hypothetical protein VMW15_03110 [Terracidiphilus sp.]|nr:hypothetical protein [Terracidiphilus sp.]
MKQSILTVVLALIAAVVLIFSVARGIWQKKRKDSAHSRRLLQLRRNLLVKALGNEYKVDSLIEFEQAKDENITLEAAMESAIERWEHDNR